MENTEIKPRWFLFKHNCGSIFTINTKNFYEVPAQQAKANKDVGYAFQCPSCQESINEKTIETFKSFVAIYKSLITELSTQHFQVREISDQDLSSLVSL